MDIQLSIGNGSDMFKNQKSDLQLSQCHCL